MRRTGLLLLLAIAAPSVAAWGQEPAPVVLPGPPPVVAADSLPDLIAHEPSSYNSYPDYGHAGSDNCHEWWCTTWYTRVELLTLMRSHDPQDRVLVQTGAGAPVLSASDIGFGLAPGVSTMLGHRIDGLTSFELSYFGANQWNDERAVAGAANLRLPGALGITLNDFNGANAMDVALRSQLHNAEINILRDGQAISFVAGFRYVGWHEQISISTLDSDLDQSDYLVNVSNNLFGGQIGARWARYHQRFDCEITGKAGLFGNEATQSQLLTNLDGATIVRNVTATDANVAFVGDLNISASCPLHRLWRLRGGYNLLLISSIALSANQLDFSNNPLSGRRLRPDSEAFLHGFNIGLEAIW